MNLEHTPDEDVMIEGVTSLFAEWELMQPQLKNPRASFPYVMRVCVCVYLCGLMLRALGLVAFAAKALLVGVLGLLVAQRVGPHPVHLCPAEGISGGASIYAAVPR